MTLSRSLSVRTSPAAADTQTPEFVPQRVSVLVGKKAASDSGAEYMDFSVNRNGVVSSDRRCIVGVHSPFNAKAKSRGRSCSSHLVQSSPGRRLPRTSSLAVAWAIELPERRLCSRVLQGRDSRSASCCLFEGRTTLLDGNDRLERSTVPSSRHRLGKESGRTQRAESSVLWLHSRDWCRYFIPSPFGRLPFLSQLATPSVHTSSPNVPACGDSLYLQPRDTGRITPPSSDTPLCLPDASCEKCSLAQATPVLQWLPSSSIRFQGRRCGGARTAIPIRHSPPPFPNDVANCFRSSANSAGARC